MIYGFDDNKNRVEVPDANFKIIDYEYDITSNSTNNPLILNVGEAVITVGLIQSNTYGKKTIYVRESEVDLLYLIIKIILNMVKLQHILIMG